jgi:hypothetical protein
VLGRRLGEVLALRLADFPPTPGSRQLIAGLAGRGAVPHRHRLAGRVGAAGCR